MPSILAASIFPAESRAAAEFHRNACLLIMLCITSGICSGLRSCCFAIANTVLVKRFRETLYLALVLQDKSFFDTETVGDLTSRLGADCQHLSKVIGNDVHLILRNIVQLVLTVMSINALKDLNSLPASESKNDDSSRGCFTKLCNGNMNENVEEEQRKKSSPIHVSGDVVTAFNDHVVDLLDPLLVQLLLKSSQDKRLVCEAAEKALEAMTTWVSPIVLLPKFDQHPESREAAQTLLLECQTAYKKSYCVLSATVHKHPELDSWEHFRRSKLSPLSTQAVLWVTNTNVA
ncbi:hypothetical protein SLEP1_g10110 [Rubroshorea leprosula]|uniref:ABC transmembrane type-1 domain-containing protein n=1 Tax=Rubroshorea leprosula TaxID=152421 RepID=A0AAV5ICS1_9ROSI|nr:hypothetical protein SLEP1_g10110 [Rubroshorea leprosula]